MRLAGIGTRNSAHSYSNTPVRNFPDFFSLNLTPGSASSAERYNFSPSAWATIAN